MGRLLLCFIVWATVAAPSIQAVEQEPTLELEEECSEVDLSHHEDDLDTLEFSLLQTSLRLDHEEHVDRIPAPLSGELPVRHETQALSSNTSVGVASGASVAELLQSNAEQSAQKHRFSGQLWHEVLCHAGLSYWLCDHHRAKALNIVQTAQAGKDSFILRSLSPKLLDIRERSGVPAQVFLFFGLLLGTVGIFILFANIHPDKRDKALGLPSSTRRVVRWHGSKNPLATLASVFGAMRPRADGSSSRLPGTTGENLSASLSEAAASLHAASVSSVMGPDESQAAFPQPPPLLPVVRDGDSDGIRPQPRPAPWDAKVQTQPTSELVHPIDSAMSANRHLGQQRSLAPNKGVSERAAAGYLASTPTPPVSSLSLPNQVRSLSGA